MFKGRTYRGKSSTPLMDEKEEGEGAAKEERTNFIDFAHVIFILT